jgi:DNA-binding transcriptional LysR family regulator
MSDIQVFEMPDLRLRELHAVVALVQYGSFVAAAAHLKMSQPTLTRAIKRVESVMGITLFARNTRRVEATPEGREFAAVAERMLRELRLTFRSLNEGNQNLQGRLTLATYSAFAVGKLPSIVKQYRELLPLMELRIREGRQVDIVEDVRSGTAEFGICYIDMVPENIKTELLRREPLYVTVPIAHPLAQLRRQRIRLEELRDEVLVSPPSNTFIRRLVDDAATSVGVILNYGLVVERLLSLLGHVRAGVGIALIPEEVLPPKPWRDFEALILTEPSLSVSVGFVTLPGRHITPAAAKMMALIREEFNGKPATAPAGAAAGTTGAPANAGAPHA